MTKTAKVALCVFVPTIKYKRMFRWDSDRFGNQDIYGFIILHWMRAFFAKDSALIQQRERAVCHYHYHGYGANNLNPS